MANNNDMEKVASNFIDSSSANKIKSNKGAINKLAKTPDAQKVQKIVEKDSAKIAAAMKSGDVSSLKGVLGNILKTEEGARLVKQINDMMK